MYADLNRNGHPDGDEPALSGVRIMVRSLGGGGTTVTFSGPNGRYEVGGLPPGMYRVEETDPRLYYSLSSNNVVVLVFANETTVVDFLDYPAELCAIPLVLGKTRPTVPGISFR